MKATGIVRRIDELGRIVIPKELRRVLSIKEGDNLEILAENGLLILKKYYEMERLETVCKDICDAIFEALGKTCLVVDREKVVGASSNAKEHLEKKISPGLQKTMEGRGSIKSLSYDGEELVSGEEFLEATFSTIIAGGFVPGGVLIVTKKDEGFSGDEDEVAKVASIYLSKFLL